MALKLEKGQRLNLSKEAPGLLKVRLGLGWDTSNIQGQEFDLDATVLLLKADGKIKNEKGIVFYNQLVSEDGAVTHNGDNRNGDAEGDDESISIELARVDSDIKKIVTIVTIHDAKTRNQNFGQVDNAYVRVINQDNETEMARFDLSEDFSVQTAVIFAELNRLDNNEWSFKPIGDGDKRTLGELLSSYGAEV